MFDGPLAADGPPERSDLPSRPQVLIPNGVVQHLGDPEIRIYIWVLKECQPAHTPGFIDPTPIRVDPSYLAEQFRFRPQHISEGLAQLEQDRLLRQHVRPDGLYVELLDVTEDVIVGLKSRRPIARRRK